MKLSVLWSSRMFGTDFYHILASFIIYSILGWFVESVYMSFCNKKITNRGFAKGPFCPIYGFGATFGSILLQPFSGSFLATYIAGALLATAFEYFAGIFMIKTVKSLWWDYNDKPYNYRGIICLESTLAWGFYAIGVVEYLNGFILRRIDSINRSYMIIFMEIVLSVAVVDYIVRLLKIFHTPVDYAKDKALLRFNSVKDKAYEEFNQVKDKAHSVYENIHSRWF